MSFLKMFINSINYDDMYCLCWCRPMVVIAGGYDQDQGGTGSFQEWNQVSPKCVWVTAMGL